MAFVMFALAFLRQAPISCAPCLTLSGSIHLARPVSGGVVRQPTDYYMNPLRGFAGDCLLPTAYCQLFSYEHPLVAPQFMQR
jgi:hypothetical protein